MKKQKIAGVASATVKGRVVLVGTYKGDQLTKWRGWYNYPISDGDFSAAKNTKRPLRGFVKNAS